MSYTLTALELSSGVTHFYSTKHITNFTYFVNNNNWFIAILDSELHLANNWQYNIHTGEDDIQTISLTGISKTYTKMTIYKSIVTRRIILPFTFYD